MSNTKIPDWINKESVRVEEARKKKFEDEGWKTFFKIPVGVTEVTIDPSIEPRETTNQNKVLRAIINGEEWDLPLSPVTYSKIINGNDNIKGMIDGNMNFKIHRIGTGQSDTRYDVTTD
jgi:hypothetical protein